MFPLGQRTSLFLDLIYVEHVDALANEADRLSTQFAYGRPISATDLAVELQWPHEPVVRTKLVHKSGFRTGWHNDSDGTLEDDWMERRNENGEEFVQPDGHTPRPLHTTLAHLWQAFEEILTIVNECGCANTRSIEKNR